MQVAVRPADRSVESGHATRGCARCSAAACMDGYLRRAAPSNPGPVARRGTALRQLCSLGFARQKSTRYLTARPPPHRCRGNQVQSQSLDALGFRVVFCLESHLERSEVVAEGIRRVCVSALLRAVQHLASQSTKAPKMHAWSSQRTRLPSSAGQQPPTER